MIFPSDLLVIPQPGFRRMVGSDQIRSGPVLDSSTWEMYTIDVVSLGPLFLIGISNQNLYYLKAYNF
jgi:hypothetical protein